MASCLSSLSVKNIIDKAEILTGKLLCCTFKACSRASNRTDTSARRKNSDLKFGPKSLFYQWN